MESVAEYLWDHPDTNPYARYVLEILYDVSNATRRVISGTSSVERACQSQRPTYTVNRELVLSRKLKDLVQKQDQTAQEAARLVGLVMELSDSNVEVVERAINARNQVFTNHDEYHLLAHKKPSWDSHSQVYFTMYERVFGEVPETVDWTRLGFQGKDPSTDFRSTGLFGMKCFEYFCSEHPDWARLVADESGTLSKDSSGPWYSLGLLSIHVTNLLMDEMISTLLKLIYLQYDADPPVSNHVLEVHSKSIMDFHKFWKQEIKEGKVKTVMDTESSINRWKEVLVRRLIAEGLAAQVERRLTLPQICA